MRRIRFPYELLNGFVVAKVADSPVTGGRKGMWVRVPSSPLWFLRIMVVALPCHGSSKRNLNSGFDSRRNRRPLITCQGTTPFLIYKIKKFVCNSMGYTIDGEALDFEFVRLIEQVKKTLKL